MPWTTSTMWPYSSSGANDGPHAAVGGRERAAKPRMSWTGANHGSKKLSTGREPARSFKITSR